MAKMLLSLEISYFQLISSHNPVVIDIINQLFHSISPNMNSIIANEILQKLFRGNTV